MSSNSRQQIQRHSFSKPSRPSPLSEPASTAIQQVPSTRKRDSQGNLLLRHNNNTKEQNQHQQSSVRQIRLLPCAESANLSANLTNNDNSNDNSNDQHITQHQDEDEEEEEVNESDSDSDTDSHYDKSTIPPQLMEKLAKFPLFQNAPKSFHKAIAGRLKLMQHHAQEYIVKFGEPAKAMYWILRGSVAVTSPDGEAVFTELVPGQFFGEIGILFNRPRTATVIARTRVLLGVLTADNFNAVLPDFPRIERMIRDEAQERLSMQEKRKRNGVTNILPNYFSTASTNDSLGTSASNMATAIASIPGPSLPPKVRSPSPEEEILTVAQQQQQQQQLPHSHSIHQSVSVPRQVLNSLPAHLQSQDSINKNNHKSLPKIHDDVDHSIPTRDFLRSLPMFTLLPSNMIHELVLGVEPKRFEPFEYIFKKGDCGRDIYFIVNGEVEVLDPKRISIVENGDDVHSGSGEKKVDKVLARLSTGQYFGEMAFLDSIQGKPSPDPGEEIKRPEPQRSADIRSISTVDLLIVTGDQLESLYSRYPQIVNEMQETANKRTDRNQADLDHDRRVESSSLFGSMHRQGTQNPFELLQSQSQSQSPPTTELFGQFNKWTGFGSANDGGPSYAKRQKQDSECAPNEDSSTLPRAKPSVLSSSTSSSTSSEIFSPSYSISHSGRNHSVSTITTTGSISDDLKFRRRPSAIISSSASSSSGPLQLTPPSMNPSTPSMSQFPSMNSRPQSPFEYMNHARRLRLTSIATGRRRSSVLSTTILPDRLLLEVFKHLSLPELMKLRLICRRWRQLLYVAPGFFETLDLRAYNRTIDDNAIRQITDFVGSRPKIIDISNCFHITDLGFCYMVNEIGMSGSIKIIRMTSVWEVSAMAIMDISVPSIGHHIEELDLSNCKKVRDDVIERIIGWRKNGHQQQHQQQQQQHQYNMHAHLDLEPVPGMEDFDQSRNSLTSKPTAGCQNIKRLNLGYCKHLTDRTMYHIAMHASDTLESLDLTRCISITDVGFAYWAYQPFPRLTRLKLSDCTFLTDKTIIAVASTACNLQVLDLSFCCALTDVSVEVLCLGCPQLRSLDLSFCGSAVSDSTLLALSIHLRNLERLVIKGCIRVTRAGIDALLSSSEALKHLDISQCRNAHVYRNNVPAARILPARGSKSAFVRNALGNVVEIVI